MNDLEKLFLSGLQGMYDCEKQLVDALADMADAADSDELKQAFSEHREETEKHVTRLEGVFRAIGQEPDRMSCKGIEGIIDEGEIMAEEFENNSALDAALIAAGQKAEHYEITSYGSLCTWAKEIGNQQALSLLKENMAEEKEADQLLSKLAMEDRNLEALRNDVDDAPLTLDLAVGREHRARRRDVAPFLEGLRP